MTSISFKTRPSRALYGQLIRLAWPIAVSTLSYTFMTVVDTWFMGRIGSSAIGGVGLGGMAAFTSVCFGFGLLRAVKVLCAQAVPADAVPSSNDGPPGEPTSEKPAPLLR